MSIDVILKDLTSAIKAQTEALNRQADTMDKLMAVDMSAAAVTTTAAEEKPAPKKKKRTAKAKPVVELVEPVVEPDEPDEPDEPAVAEPEPAEPMTKEVAQERLRGIASQLTDTAPLFDLIKKHGGAQFSDLDPSCYEELLSDAEAELATQKAVS